MKKVFLVLLLCSVCLPSFAITFDMDNGWKRFVCCQMDTNSIEGIYSYAMDDTTKIHVQINIVEGDTLCSLSINRENKHGDKYIFYVVENKATYYYDVFEDSLRTRFSALRFFYDKDDNFTSGREIYPNKGQNKLAVQVASRLLNNHSVRFAAMKAMAEYQEIKEFVLPAITTLH